MSAKEVAAAIAQAEEDGWHIGLSGGPAASLPRYVSAIVSAIGNDEVLGQAAVDWVKRKKGEMEYMKLVALYGREWVDAQIAAMQTDT